uniref:Uncharacterized protein n=1 Tax=Avena sativa TaxID=4498 RepID=A0ACD6AKY5_AVESA
MAQVKDLPTRPRLPHLHRRRPPPPRNNRQNDPEAQEEAPGLAGEARLVTEPYHGHASPSPAQCLAIRDALLAFHSFPDEFAPFRLRRLGLSPEDDGGPPAPRPTVLDGLVITLLSQNSTDAISRRAFASLKAAFPSWDQVVDEEGKGLEDAIRCGGLAATKAARIRAILRGVREKRGAICLEYLQELSVDEVKRELSQFKGIGPKTVACVLMFYLQKDDFTVDTHVLRITTAIGWVPPTATREKRSQVPRKPRAPMLFVP